MNIGMYTTSLPAPGRKPGGVDVLIDRLAAALATRGHTVVIHTYSERPPGAPYEVDLLGPSPLPDHKLGRIVCGPSPMTRISVAGHDVLHLHGDDWFYLRRSVPTVRTFYGSALYEARTATSWRRRAGQWTTFALELLAARLATANYGLIPGDGRWYHTIGSLGCGVDLDDSPGASATRRSEHPTILFVGTWEGRKRGRLLADAFEQHILPTLPDAELIMVSDRIEPRRGITDRRPAVRCGAAGAVPPCMGVLSSELVRGPGDSLPGGDGCGHARSCDAEPGRGLSPGPWPVRRHRRA